MEQWVMKQERLIVHTRSYNATMGNESSLIHYPLLINCNNLCEQ
ncbi:hypothetical protein KSS87_013468 [Heliosperma pusillum]|nr:hypothetical protein KSS87_013468 [Heliosperma pusillum]